MTMVRVWLSVMCENVDSPRGPYTQIRRATAEVPGDLPTALTTPGLVARLLAEVESKMLRDEVCAGRNIEAWEVAGTREEIDR